MNNAQPLVEHLKELRRRLIWIVAVLLLCLFAAVPFANTLYTLVATPLMESLPPGAHMQAIDVIAPIFVPLKVALMAAFLLSLPHTLYQLWAFVAPALYRHEKRLIAPLLLSSVCLFFAGMAFCYFLVFPLVFKVFAAATPEGVSMMTDIDRYLSFVLGMFVAFGAAFELPVLVVLLYRMGMVPLDTLKTARPYVIVAAFVVAGIITPPDVISQFLLAVPLIALYEAGLLMCRLTKPKEETAKASEAADSDSDSTA